MKKNNASSRKVAEFRKFELGYVISLNSDSGKVAEF
jgi:hypothetical protein